MSWWITIYLSKPLDDLNAARLRDGITDRDPTAHAGVDYDTLAESYDVDEDLVGDAVSQLAVHQVGEDPLDLEVRYGSDRPIVVHRWREPARVAEELAEAEEVRSPPGSVLERLRQSREVIGLELGFSQLEDMGIVFGFEIARYVAQRGDGIIVDDDDQWSSIVDGGFESIP
jgi:hypothetical protein